MRTSAQIILISGLLSASMGACVVPITVSSGALPENVQHAVDAACGIIVPLSDIANILAAGTSVVGALGSAESWATLICNSFAHPVAANRRGTRITTRVNGVVIHGVRR